MDLTTHPAFATVDKNFLHSLQKTLNSLNYKSDLEVIGTLMAISNEATKKNIKFTPEMQTALLDYLKLKLPANKRSQFDAIVKMLQANVGKKS